MILVQPGVGGILLPINHVHNVCVDRDHCLDYLCILCIGGCAVLCFIGGGGPRGDYSALPLVRQTKHGHVHTSDHDAWVTGTVPVEKHRRRVR